MQIVLKDSRHYILRFDKGEEIVAGLLEFAELNEVKAAAFNGIGAANYAELGFFDLEKKTYEKQVFAEEVEIISLIGNLAVLAGRPVLHVHGSFGRRDFSVVGGHVIGLRVSVTCEILLTLLDGRLERRPDSGLNLNLLYV